MCHFEPALLYFAASDDHLNDDNMFVVPLLAASLLPVAMPCHGQEIPVYRINQLIVHIHLLVHTPAWIQLRVRECYMEMHMYVQC